ncbi:DUF2934 domain-containing protein [Rhodoblastus sp.]|uniref:DUF2934 domain-containing protein n=1 Tax=Rhodoblastus sp. TaxID=1962975 RepID=UPI002626749A|nr:DUF2934 domain-containing protein [Rhodoblastus sp.]
MPAPATRRSASTKTSAPAKAAAPAKRKPAAKKAAAAATPSVPRDAVIARLAYAFAESRGFAPGRELDDWLAAEARYEVMPEGERLTVL